MKLQHKLLITFLLFSFVTLSVISIQAYTLMKREIISNRVQQISAIAEKQKQKINIILQRALEQNTTFSSLFELRQALRSYLDTASPAYLNILATLLRDEVTASEGDILDIYLVRDDGTVIISTKTRDPAGPQERFVFAPCVNAVRFCIQPESYFTVGSVYYEGVALATLYISHPVDIINMVALDYEGLGTSGETIIGQYDENNSEIIHFVTAIRSDSGAAFTRTVNRSETGVPIVAALNQKEEIWTSARDYRGIPVLAVSKYIDLASWGLVVKMDVSEALTPLWNYQVGLLITVNTVVAVAVLLSLHFSAFITRPFKKLTQAANDMASGDLSKQVHVGGRDEIARLADAFNAMREKLLKYQKNLESQIEERTGDLQKAKKDLEEKIQVVEKQNINAGESKRAMANLLEDSRELEKNLKKERDTATAILSTMNEGVCVIDRNGKIVIMNNAAGNTLGIEPSACIDKHYTEIFRLYESGVPVANDDHRPVLKTLSTGVALSGGLRENYQYQHTNGNLIPVAWDTVALKEGEEIAGEIITFRDISRDLAVKQTVEREVVERTHELNEEKQRLSASVSSLPIGFILIDTAHTVQFINGKALKILGTEKGSVRIYDDFVHLFPDDSPLIKLHEDYHKEKIPTERTGEIVYGTKILNVVYVPIQTRENDTVENLGSIILLDDITEAKVLERSREEFFSIASHELRTPLTAIRGNTSLIIDHYRDKMEPDCGEMITDIHNSSIRLIAIVNDFLDMSRLEQGRITFHPSAVVVPDLIRQALKEYEVTGSRRHIALEFVEPGPALPAALADSDRTRQVLVNLIGNALKFTENGSVKISVKETQKQIEVRITDTGRGIPLENQALLFHKFQQAGDSLYTRDASRGTGLGLYISRLIVEGMGGSIWLVSSESGKGSTFAFTLPAQAGLPVAAGA